MKRILPLLLAAALPTAGAEFLQVPGTDVYYSYETDAMTDANESYMLIGEINDTAGATAFYIICREGQAEVFLKTKNTLLSADDHAVKRTPNLMYRVDAQQAKTIPTATALKNDEPDYTALTFDKARTQILLTAFSNAQQKIAVRILRNDASALDYTFSTKGFKDAWRNVKSCK
jgi:hypothetical protein